MASFWAVSACFGDWGIPFELLTHFWLHGMVGSTFICIVAAALRAPRIGLAGLVLTAAYALPVLRMPTHIETVPEQETKGTVYTIVWANVDRNPDALEAVLEMARTANADLVGLAEIPLEMPRASLQEAAPEFPHLWTSPFFKEEHRFPARLAVLSRRDLQDANLTELPQTLQPRSWFEARLPAADGEASLSLVFAHPIAPDYPGMVKDRNAYFDHIVDRLEVLDQGRGRFALIGDLNVTPWAPDFRRLPGRRVGDARFHSTWLTCWPLLGLPLDHVMLSDKVAAQSKSFSAPTGSDHRAVLVELSFQS